MPTPATTHTAGSVARCKLMLIVGIEPRTANLAVEHCMHCATLALPSVLAHVRISDAYMNYDGVVVYIIPKRVHLTESEDFKSL